MPHQLLTAIKTNDFKTFSDLLGLPSSRPSIDLNKPGDPEDGLIEEEVPAISLHLAAYLGRAKMVECLLKKGADPEQPDPFYGCTALELVLRDISNPEMISDKCSIIQSLCRAGAIISEELMSDLVSRYRESFASRQQKACQSLQAIAKTLHQHYLFPNFSNCIRAGNLKKVTEYLNSKHILKDEISGITISSFRIDPNQDLGYGKVILIAATLETPNILELLYQHKADLAVTNKEGRNVIHCAARYGRAENIEWIVNKLSLEGREIYGFLNGHDEAGYTPLHFSTRYEHFSTTEKLLSLGANPELTNKKGQDAKQMSEVQAMQDLFNKVYKVNFPSLLSLCITKLAYQCRKPHIRERIKAQLPETLKPLILSFRPGLPLKENVIPSEKVKEAATSESNKSVKAKRKKKKGAKKKKASV